MLLANESARPSVRNCCTRLLVFLGMICVMATPDQAQAIRKFIDARGETYYTNQRPEDNPLPCAPTATAPAASIAPASAPVPVDVPTKPSPPINPAMEHGDWPPRALLNAPDPAK
jgi:hypothetical protein